jgi:hypothetical protein
MFKLFTLLVAVTFSLNSYAGSSRGLVSTPLVSSGDAFFFSAGNHLERPACATQTLGTWAVDLKTEHGKATMSLVLSAQAQGKTVNVQGKDNCDAWGDRESVSFIFIVD